jgi:acetoacetyl-CoA synthetase
MLCEVAPASGLLMTDNSPAPLWTPSAERIAASRMRGYMDWLAAERGLRFAGYDELWRWSVSDIEGFWKSMWDYFDIRHSTPWRSVLSERRMPGASWFPGARLNLAEQAFRFHCEDPERTALFSRSEDDALRRMSWGELRAQVAALAQAMRQLGIVPGDRVVAYLPNVPEAVVGFLACASIGAIWSSCSPDMGTVGVLDRFRQIEPALLIAADGYRYAGRTYDRLAVVEELRAGLPSLRHTVLVGPSGNDGRLSGALRWSDLIANGGTPDFEQVPFDHPLWIVFSSGTTGLPKAIVHGHGGALLETLKSHALHLDLGPDDRFLWLTSTGWIMWNYLVGGLLVGATICLYDGHPDHPAPGALWRFAGQTRASCFGAGAAYFGHCIKAGIEPADVADLGALRTVGSTGSPLSEDGYRWLAERLGDVLIAPISGGTDVATAFVGCCPLLPVFAGEMQCRWLGVAACALDDDGRALENAVGELVVTEPMPSMPLYFWNDADGRRMQESYFDTFPGLWRHGDWIRFTRRGGAVIHGRSDTTVNRHGVRMGTAEFYRVIEGFAEVADSLVVDLEYLGKPSQLLLFVVPAEGRELDEDLTARLRAALRSALSPRHLPDRIIAAPDIPRTLGGKKMELPVKKLLLGLSGAGALNEDAMSNPDSLAFYRSIAAAMQAH